MQVRRASGLYLFLLALSIPAPIFCQRKTGKRWSMAVQNANWTALLSQPSAFYAKSQYRLKKRPEGYETSAACNDYVGPGYLENIRRSRYTVCGSAARGQFHDVSILCAEYASCRSVVDCYTAPFVRAGNSSKASVSLCKSQNLLLTSCRFLSGDRKGTLSKKFPLPERGAVKLACPLVKADQAAKSGSNNLEWMRNTQHDVWWANATQDGQSVFKACAPNSSTLVTTPTLFLMRDRHANYAHELEALSMAFSFLVALEPKDVAVHGVQVVIADRAPATGFLETWARISRPHPLRILADDPFPPNTCFRSAFHIHTFAGGIGYNTNPATIGCESAVVTGLSHWLRQQYGEGDASSRAPMAAPTAEAVAGPAAAAAGVRGLRPPAGGIVLKNVVWLSRRNLEALRLVLDASVGWQSMRMVRNEAEVVAGILAAVQEWNAESCLLRRFDRTVKSEYELSLTVVNPIHSGAAAATRQLESGSGPASVTAVAAASATTAGSATAVAAGSKTAVVAGSATAAAAAGRRSLLALSQRRHQALHQHPELDQEQLDDKEEEGGEGEEEEWQAAADSEEALSRQGRTLTDEVAAAAGGGTGDGASIPYAIGNNVVALDKVWQQDAATADGCRRTNVLFKFVEADFNDMSYHMQLQTIFRSGVLAGVHGAGLAHGFFMPPGQSAVLQLLGRAFAKAAANNVFRNMAGGMGNFYEDVLYGELDVDVRLLKAAVKRAMDFVARRVMEAQLRRSGALRLVLVDQSHFSIVVPSQQQCPANGIANVTFDAARRLTERNVNTGARPD